MDYIAAATDIWTTPEDRAVSAPSKWPLPTRGRRFVTPAFMLQKLARHPLTRECYPAAMGFYPAAGEHRMQRDRHDDNLLIYCVEGEGQASVGDWAGRVAEGDMLLLPQGLAHRYQASADNPWTIYWVHYQGSATAIFNQYLGYREGACPVTRIGVSPQLVARFRELMAVHRTGYSTRAFINAANLLRQILTQIALEVRSAQARGQQSFDLEAIQSFMLEHIDQQLELDTLAAAANLSRFHFSSKYKSLTGYSPIKHFLNMKMEHACHLLDSSALSVKGVAAAVGYDDPLYFSRLFRNTVGMSPRDYRRSVRN
ncbi:MAG: AraC family transcriptional regulator [Halioglobus sp.]|nr:AraC family transcriptional regulator [Halioglobus sp.]